MAFARELSELIALRPTLYEFILISPAKCWRDDCLDIVEGDAMHVHGNRINPTAANLYSAVAAEKSAKSKRAAEVRKKLILGAAKLEGELDAHAISISGKGSEERSHQHPGSRDIPASQIKQNADEEQSAEVVSMWA